MQGYPGGNYGSNYPQPSYPYGGPQPPMNPPGHGGYQDYAGGPPPPIGMPGGNVGYPSMDYSSSPYNAGSQPTYPSQPTGFPQAGGGYPTPSVSHGSYPTPNSGYPAGGPPNSGYPVGGPVVGSGYPGGSPMPNVGYSAGAPTQGFPGSGPVSTAGYPVGVPGHGGGYQPGGPAPGGYPVGVPNQSYGGGHGYPDAAYGAQPGAYPQGGPGMAGGVTPGGLIGSGGERHQGTIRPDPSFNAEADCNALRTAMRGMGTDEQAIINVLCRRSAQQRQQIKTMYKTMFGKDLIQALRSELSGRFEDAILALLMDPIYYDAHCLRQAMQGAGTNERTVTEIMCTRTNEQIRFIREVYKREYHRELEQDLSSDTSGFYRRVLVSCAQGNRQELSPQQMQLLMTQGPNAVVDRGLAQREAQELYQAGEKRLGTDESCFIRIIATRNMFQLRATFDEFQRIAGHDILTSIDREMSGDFGESMKSLALSQINRPYYFANRLYNAMRGMGTADTTLIRVIVTRSELDLADIKREFQRAYGKTLDSFIQGDTSGDYKNLLLAIVAGN